jgi:hypothetical protein
VPTATSESKLPSTLPNLPSLQHEAVEAIEALTERYGETSDLDDENGEEDGLVSVCEESDSDSSSVCQINIITEITWRNELMSTTG